MTSPKEIDLKDYVLKRINGMKATAFEQVIIRKIHNKGGESCHLYGYGFIIEEFFNSQEELDASGRRPISTDYEKRESVYYEDGSILAKSFVCVYDSITTDIEMDLNGWKSLVFDPRFFVVALLYPKILDVYPDYMKQFCRKELRDLVMEQNYKSGGKYYLSIFSSQVLNQLSNEEGDYFIKKFNPVTKQLLINE